MPWKGTVPLFTINTRVLTAKRSHLQPQSTTSAFLSPFNGDWNREKAAQLLRRTTYGPTYDEIDRIYRMGLSKAVDHILRRVDVPSPPVKYFNKDNWEPTLNIGETWVNTPYIGNNRYRHQSLKGWFHNYLMDGKTTIQGRMTFFWLNYFAIRDIMDHRCQYSYLKLFQQQATQGNFREMIEKITIHPAMLYFLDGAVNSKKNPNENYARELMELFTIGKGEAVGEGDYTTFTEQDVAALARALTGWKVTDFNLNDEDIPVDSWFDASDHDTGTKRLSHRFGNQTIKNEGSREYLRVISILFAKKDAALHFCKELYRYFIFHDVTDDVYAHVIHPLADTLVANNFDITPVLKRLFMSRHFFEDKHHGAILKNPFDYLTSILRPFGEYWHEPLSLERRVQLGDSYSRYAEQLGLQLLAAPTVAGWKAYYDAPQYYRHWISPALMQRRFELASEFTRHTYHVKQTRVDLDYYNFVKRLPSKRDVNKFIDDVVLIFLPQDITDRQKQGLKENLLMGLNDNEWSRHIDKYMANPNERMHVQPVEDRLRRFFTALFGMAEFQLQ